jgi:hypothetical protein
VGALADRGVRAAVGAHGGSRVETQVRAAACARHDSPEHQVRYPDEAGDESGPWALVDLLRVVQLLDDAPVHDRDAIGHRQCLLLVVRHVDERDAHLLLDALELHLQLLAQLEIERPERLVEEQHGGAVHERTGEGDALLLSTGELARLALGFGREADPLQLFPHACTHLVAGYALAFEPEGHVFLHAHMRNRA